MNPFLDKIAERLLYKFPDDMENVAVILPNKRAIVFLKHYISKKITKPKFLPHFFSVEEFVEHLTGLKVLDNISLQFFLYRSYLLYPPKKVDSFDDFLNWSNVLLHDMNEVDRNMVDPKAIFSNLTKIKELESWNIEDWSLANENLTNEQENFIAFYQRIYSWYVDFNKSLLKQNYAYQGMAFRKVAEEISHISIPWKKVWFVGLNALTRSEQKIIEYLKQKDIARVFWDADVFYYNNPKHEAGEFLRKQKERWDEIDFHGVGEYYSKPKKRFDVVACPRNISQAKVAGKVLSELSIDDLNASNTAIVLADEGLLYPVLNNLPTNIRKFNVTMGSPLQNTSLFAFIDTMMTMQMNANYYNKKVFYYKDVHRFLEHPYFLKICDKNEVYKLKNIINHNNFIFLNNKFIIKNLSKKEIHSLFAIWKKSGDVIESFYLIVELLRKLLVEKKGTIESEILLSFYTCIMILENLIRESNFEIELQTLQKILKQIIAKEVIPFQGEPLDGVQLMGILESRTLDFKNVIMLSVNEGKLPKRKSVNSFIPYDVKKFFEMPTYSESDAVFAYHFFRLLQRAENITLTYNTDTDHFAVGEKSRFITQLLFEYSASPIKEYVFKGEQLQLLMSNDIIIKNEKLDNEIANWAENGVSPSALNKYINCSLAFYYYYLANIKKDDEVDEFADASHLGVAVHNSLDKIYKKVTLSKQQIDQWQIEILNQIQLEYLDILNSINLDEGKNYLSLEIAKKLTIEFLKLEKRQIEILSRKGKKITIKGLEEKLKDSITVNGTKFRLQGRVDRIDEAGEFLRIIDYKTGKVESTELTFFDWEELSKNNKKGRVFQLLMYAYLYLRKYPDYLKKKIVVGNFSFKNLKDGLICVSKNIKNKEGKRSYHKELLLINKKVLQRFEEQLINILEKIQTDDFTKTNDKKVCEWCDYKLICNR